MRVKGERMVKGDRCLERHSQRLAIFPTRDVTVGVLVPRAEQIDDAGAVGHERIAQLVDLLHASGKKREYIYCVISSAPLQIPTLPLTPPHPNADANANANASPRRCLGAPSARHRPSS